MTKENAKPAAPTNTAANKSAVKTVEKSMKLSDGSVVTKQVK